MFFDGDGFPLMQKQARFHRPTERQGQQRKQLPQPLGVSEVSRFEAKAAGFEQAEEGFNAPAIVPP